MKEETVICNPKGCWRICIVTAVILFCTVGLNITAFSIYIPYITDLLQLTYSQSANFILVRNLFSFASLFVVKRYYEKLDLRAGFALAMVLAVIGFFLYSQATNFTTLCIAATISGLAYGLGGMYPTALLIRRWFSVHESLATGICAASTGIAGIIGAPVLTALTERFSVRSTLRFEAIFLLVCACICTALIRNYPPNTVPEKAAGTTKPRTRVKPDGLFFVLLAVGIMGGPGYAYISMLYTTEGMDAYRVSALISVMGVALVIGKFALGELLDRHGALRAPRLFFITALLGCVILCFGDVGFIPALLAVMLFGFGNALGTLTPPAYAKDISTPETYSATQQQYQMAFLLGGLVGSPIPGFVATITQNYKGFYFLILVIVLQAFFAIPWLYRRHNKQ